MNVIDYSQNFPKILIYVIQQQKSIKINGTVNCFALSADVTQKLPV